MQKLFCRRTLTSPKPANGAGIHGLNMSEITMVTGIVCPEATVTVTVQKRQNIFYLLKAVDWDPTSILKLRVRLDLHM